MTVTMTNTAQAQPKVSRKRRAVRAVAWVADQAADVALITVLTRK